MLDLSPVDAVLIRCFSEPGVLDGFPAVAGAAVCRVAADELILIGPPTVSDGLTAQATAYLGSVDPDGLVIPHTDAWSFWAISGESRQRAFARLSANALPRTSPAFIQGAIAQLPGKTLVLSDSIVMMVPSTVGHHLPERVLAACADLKPQPRGTRPLAIEGGIRLLNSRTVEAGTS